MAQPKRPVQRRKSSTASRLRRFWIVFVVVVLVVGGAAYALASWAGFDAKGVVVEGNRVSPTAAILERAAIGRDQNIWLLDTRAIAARVEKLPYVKIARVHRQIPNVVSIDVIERVPYAVLQTPSGKAVIDDDLHVLADGANAPGLPLLVVRRAVDLVAGAVVNDKDVATLCDAEQKLLAGHVAPVSLAEDRYDELVVTLRGGVRVLMGDDTEFDRKIALIDPVLAQVQNKERAISEIDLRAPNTPVVVYR